MPTPKTVENFILLVESGQTLEAIRQYYADDARVQENQSETRQGQPIILAHEEQMLSKVDQLICTHLPPFFVDGDHVVIRWKFEMTWKNGKTSTFEELAYQTWNDQKIQTEQFFYDPGQMRPE